MKRRQIIITLFSIIISIYMSGVLQVEAATNFGDAEPSSDIVSEKPEDLFTSPYCFYKGEGKYKGIEIWAEKTQSSNIPTDGTFIRDILFVNNTEYYLELTEDGDAKISGDLNKYTEGMLVIFHPNPLWIRLAPGETTRACFTVDFANNLMNLKSNIKGKLVINENYRVTLSGDGHYEKLDNISVTIPSEVNAYTYDTLKKAENINAVLSGYVRDSSGKVLAGAEITINDAITEPVTVKTNSKGYYKATVFASYNKYYGIWHSSSLTVTKDGYAKKELLVFPESNQVVKTDITLSKSRTPLKYKLAKTYMMGIQGNYYDSTTDGSVIASVPFHSGLSAEEMEKNSNLMIFDKTGNIHAKVLLGAETSCVDVSTDGKYIISQEDHVNYSITKLFDKSGKVVYERGEFPPTGEKFSMIPMQGETTIKIRVRAAAISDDNKYLIIGSVDGDIYCIDWKKDEIIWTSNIRNQIRTIDFSKDGELIYFSSGDAYFYCYTKDGILQWKTFTGSWATTTSIGEKYVALSTKCVANSIRLLDAKTGELCWCYKSPSRGTVSLSPDESMLYYGTDAVSAFSVEGSQVLDTETGKVKYLAGFMGQSAAWSADSKYLVVKGMTTLYVYDALTGEELWSEKVSENYGGNLVLYVSEDAGNLVAGFIKESTYGNLYFYKRESANEIKWKNTDITLVVGEKKTFSVIVDGYDLSKLSWGTEKKAVAVCGKNTGKMKAVIKATSAGTDFVYVKYGDKKVLRIKVTVTEKK